MRAFLTGSSGFVGGWLRRHLEAAGDEVSALVDSVDITDAAAVKASVAAAAPEVIYHLAALTHVGRSWMDPTATMQVNALGTLALLEAAQALPHRPRVVLVSSAEVYGMGDGTPLTEDAPLRPMTPYAVSKVAAEYLGIQAHLGRGLDVVRVRPFNHVGPGQTDSFVVPGLARRIVAAERAGGGAVTVGNLSALRDFTDVRDVVRAYRLLALSGGAGDVYNVCSGEGRPIASILERLVALARTAVEVVEDPDLVRPIEVPVLVGDPTHLAKATGWAPEIDLEETLADVLDEWRAR